jgi:hypothetical protein
MCEDNRDACYKWRMNAPDTNPPPDQSLTERTWAWWTRHRFWVLPTGTAVMALLALGFLAYQTWRLLWQPPPMGAVDLIARSMETRAFFAGQAIYRLIPSAVYPPASMVMMWPILGWPSLEMVRWLWALLSAITLAWMTRPVSKGCGAVTGAERRLAMILPFAMYATGASVGNGQFSLLVVACLVASLPILLEGQGGLRGALAVLGFVVALIKPSLAAPFFWMVLFRPGRSLLALAVVAIYLGLTAVAGIFQPGGLLQMIFEFMSHSQKGATWGAAHHGYANLHSWLGAIGLQKWDGPGSFLVLGALGIWTWRHRRADPWLLMSAAAFTSRFWTYHGWYDDLVLLIPVMALFRITKQSKTAGQKIWSGSLWVAMMCSTLAPGGLYSLPQPLSRIYVAVQVTIWLIACLFLLRATNLSPATGMRCS